MQCKKGMYFSFDFGWYSILILSVKNRGLGEFLLNEQNLLSVKKFICRQSLKSSDSLRQIDASWWVGLALWHYDLTHEISVFVKLKHFLILRKNTSLNKDKPSAKPIIAKSQEFELFTLRHFKIAISTKPHGTVSGVQKKKKKKDF